MIDRRNPISQEERWNSYDPKRGHPLVFPLHPSKNIRPPRIGRGDGLPPEQPVSKLEAEVAEKIKNTRYASDHLAYTVSI